MKLRYQIGHTAARRSPSARLQGVKKKDALVQSLRSPCTFSFAAHACRELRTGRHTPCSIASAARAGISSTLRTPCMQAYTARAGISVIHLYSYGLYSYGLYSYGMPATHRIPCIVTCPVHARTSYTPCTRSSAARAGISGASAAALSHHLHPHPRWGPRPMQAEK